MTYTDIFSQWTESRAVWNKGAAGVVTRTREVEAARPFLLLGFDSDNGGEFLNYHLWRYFSERATPVSFTRSRPYHNNDNAHVEQKNWAHARQPLGPELVAEGLLGCERLEAEALLEPINALYTEVWNPRQNFFCPALALREKVKEGSRYRKRYAPAQTACARLLAWPDLKTPQRRELRARQAELDPLALAEDKERRLREIFAMARRSSRPTGSLRAAPLPAPKPR